MTSTYDTVLKTTAPARGPRAPKFAFPVLDRIVGATTTRVLNLDALTPTVVRWELERRAGYHFRASQHALLGVITTEGPDLRPLSLAGAPGDNHLEFATRAGPSALKQRVIGLRPGGIVKVSRPMGGLTYDPARAAIFIVGGIGTTPARSLLRATEYSTSQAPIRLLFSNRAAHEIRSPTNLPPSPISERTCPSPGFSAHPPR